MVLQYCFPVLVSIIGVPGERLASASPDEMAAAASQAFLNAPSTQPRSGARIDSASGHSDAVTLTGATSVQELEAHVKALEHQVSTLLCQEAPGRHAAGRPGALNGDQGVTEGGLEPGDHEEYGVVGKEAFERRAQAKQVMAALAELQKQVEAFKEYV